MRTDIITFALESPYRKEIVKTLFAFPDRHWTCSAMETATKISHPTVFRTLKNLEEFGMLNKTKINKKDFIFEVVDSPLTQEVKKIVTMNIDQEVAKKIANKFVPRIEKNGIISIILYGSTVKGTCTAKSDIDILIVIKKHVWLREKEIQNVAADMSLKVNKALSIVILDKKEVKKEKNRQFIQSVRENMQVLYGKESL